VALPALKEAELRKIMVPGQLRQAKMLQDPISTEEVGHDGMHQKKL
jgi:hypothetical protein